MRGRTETAAFMRQNWAAASCAAELRLSRRAIRDVEMWRLQAAVSGDFGVEAAFENSADDLRAFDRVGGHARCEHFLDLRSQRGRVRDVGRRREEELRR